MSVCLKKRDVIESLYGQTISSRSPSRVLEQVDDRGMRRARILSDRNVFCKKNYERQNHSDKAVMSPGSCVDLDQ